ncbi:ABC transporter ATP-binding protein [Nocardiopsis sp. NPDC006139]|uniref:ABC transporter ATP-binding protein n=1 Tax=unclassified Nocardiopsis TaxID=2649073 RepID=UPI0033B83707
MLSLRGLTRTYRRGSVPVPALRGVDADFGPGGFTAIMGPSGSGKSTLLHCAAGLDRPDGGQVLLGGRDLARMPERDLTRLRAGAFGFVFQDFNLLPSLTARENVELTARLSGRPPDASRRDALADLLDLRDRLDHRPAELSGGQCQRVALLRALVHRPDVLFADEPTGALDTRSGGRVLDALRHAVDHDGRTVVMVTHDPAAAARADRVLFLRDGLIVDTLTAPTPAAVLDRMGAR